jgi:hypothetical protein
MTLKFVVMSDLHVVPEGELSMTLDTGARLHQAVDAVIALWQRRLLRAGRRPDRSGSTRRL